MHDLASRPTDDDLACVAVVGDRDLGAAEERSAHAFHRVTLALQHADDVLMRITSKACRWRQHQAGNHRKGQGSVHVAFPSTASDWATASRTRARVSAIIAALLGR